MIIVDLNQVMISTLMISLGQHAPKYVNKNVDDGDYENEGLLRHFILNSIRGYNHKFKDEYGELIIACDDKNYWRKDVYPYYKANRKKDRDASDLDWNTLFKSLNKIRDELKEFFPFRVIKVDRAEADDVIATLCHQFGNTHEKILIISGDKDFRQLQSYFNVKQYSPVQKKYITENNPDNYLKEHIMLGDGGDGVPNFLSPDDKYVANIRAKPISQKKLKQWVNMKPEDFCDETMLRGYKRNEALVDLWKIPEDLQANIIDEYNAEAGKNASKLMTYFMKNNLKELTDVITQFKVHNAK